MRRTLLLLLPALVGLSCGKAPLVDVHAGFVLADATWFAEEETLFVFYRVEAEQGLSPESQLELAYRTDDVDQPWTPLSELEPVHTHLKVDCGAEALCGSTSVHVRLPPSQVQLRLRYHRDGELTLPAAVTLNVVGPGPAQSHRSLLVYGVFDQENRHVQWRARHQFPDLRNEEVEALGLRRTFQVSEAAFGAVGPLPDDNPYGYAFAAGCPAGMTPLGFAPIETQDRAVFERQALPLTASAEPAVCATATVTDAKGTFSAPALARKNPEVRPAFPALHSPIRSGTEVGFILEPCTRTISAPHLAMQEQRLLLDGAPELCTEDWQSQGFADALAATFRARIDQVRADGKDMVLAVVLHQDEPTGGLSEVLEQALEEVLPSEQEKSSPRVTGAFVFDSVEHLLSHPALRQLVIWCPETGGPDDLDLSSATASHSCPVQPDRPDVQLGPFKFNNLPILPTRTQYLNFIDKYSDDQAGHTVSLTFLAPERTPSSENVRVGDFGVATFFNNEAVSAAPEDAFSYCAGGDERSEGVVFRVPPDEDPLPLSALPQVQQVSPQPFYPLGLLWDFPYLSRLEYEVTIAGAASAFSLTVPFGISSTSEKYFGTELWSSGDFPLSNTLTQCTRFCDHPTFDSAGVYQVLAPFRVAYADTCYRPLYPALTDGGFPRDP